MAGKQNYYYNVLQNDKYGRYLVANKDLDSGDIIFTDSPFAVGPKPDSPPICLGCYCLVKDRVCSRCGWPVCGAECEVAPHHLPECDVFTSARERYVPREDRTAPTPQLDCITPLRVLLAREQDPVRWQHELEPMECHTLARQQRRATWNADQINVANYLVDRCKLGARFDKELVQKVCGILEVNSVEIPSHGGFSVRAVYPRLAIAAHSCVPNIVHTILHDQYQVEVRAAVTIKSGDPLYLCYTYALSPTVTRRDYLLQSKFFPCECTRCTDATELSTHLSTLKCRKCSNGVILSSNPLDNEAPWKCSGKNCKFKTSGPAMRRMLGVIQIEVDKLDALQRGLQAIQSREATLKKYKSVLHPRHSIMLSIKHALAQLYGRVEGYGTQELSEPMLERKVSYCRLVLQTLDVITPGETRMRGMMLYELHTPLVVLARRKFSAGLITKQTLKERLQEPIECLSQAARILMREDSRSPEGVTGRIAHKLIVQLKKNIESL